MESDTQASDDVFVEAKDQTFSVNRVSVKLPPFQRADPEVWFAIIERSFNLAGVSTDDTKFSYAIQGLDLEAQVEVRDILISPPSQNKFDTLKTELIKRLSKTTEQRHRQLLQHEELGDSKPSQFLRRLRNLSGSGMSDEMLRTFWTSRLPRSMQGILATQKKCPLDEIAELADAISESESPLTGIDETSKVSGIDMLEQEVAALRLELNELRGTANKRWRKRDHSPHSSSRSHAEVCWYHKKLK